MPSKTDERIVAITQKIIERSQKSRAIYLKRMQETHSSGAQRGHLGCSNLAHAMAPCSNDEKKTLEDMKEENIAIVSAYNDMLSAHQPFVTYPSLIKGLWHLLEQLHSLPEVFLLCVMVLHSHNREWS